MKSKEEIYLKMITIACIETNNNMGVFRKVIWDYLLQEFKDVVDYRDFLYAISNLVKSGKLNNN